MAILSSNTAARHAFVHFPTIPLRQAHTRANPRPSSVPRPADNPDRGPASTEDTQTDFNALDVLGNTTPPTTAIDACVNDGFLLDSGLKITDGDGVMLIGGEAFVWRPWMSSSSPQSSTPQTQGIIKGNDLAETANGTGGLINSHGLFELSEDAWGVLKLLWPKPDLVILGTGQRIVPLAKQSRERLQECGVRIEVLDTRNAASQYNLLVTERGTTEVVAALVPVGFGVKGDTTKRRR